MCLAVKERAYPFDSSHSPHKFVRLERSHKQAYDCDHDTRFPIFDSLESARYNLDQQQMRFEHTLSSGELVVHDVLVGRRVLDRMLERAIEAVFS